ncbi:hypothetical protein GCM10009599_16070 [Luteococcus peritonei]
MTAAFIAVGGIYVTSRLTARREEQAFIRSEATRLESLRRSAYAELISQGQHWVRVGRGRQREIKRLDRILFGVGVDWQRVFEGGTTEERKTEARRLRPQLVAEQHEDEARLYAAVAGVQLVTDSEQVSNLALNVLGDDPERALTAFLNAARDELGRSELPLVDLIHDDSVRAEDETQGEDHELGSGT